MTARKRQIRLTGGETVEQRARRLAHAATCWEHGYLTACEETIP
jgi:ribosomal protein L34E